jgi:hypothetical protein
LVKDGTQWRALVSTVMNLWVSIEGGELLEQLGFSRTAVELVVLFTFFTR